VLGDVSEPEAVGSVGCEAALHQVIVDGRQRTSVLTSAPVDAAQVGGPHQPGHAFAAAVDVPAEPELVEDTWRPVRLARNGVDLLDLQGERLVGHGTG
jgi:hypothetical protein